PRDRGVEERPRALAGGPGPIVDPTGQLVFDVCEVPPAVLPGDLPLVFEARLLPLQVRPHARGVGISSWPASSRLPAWARRGDRPGVCPIRDNYPIPVAPVFTPVFVTSRHHDPEPPGRRPTDVKATGPPRPLPGAQ